MNEYELTVLTSPDADEAGTKKVLAAVAKLVTDAKGKVVSEDDWGKQRLEYKIQNETHAVFHWFKVELPGEAVAKVDQALNIADGVLRHLIVRHDAKRQALADATKKSKDE